jgi:oxepin-CoA hydrolase/3-oxo-5,6-dehydrosuberyl-CoA semialdehyde dehydrogenase
MPPSGKDGTGRWCGEPFRKLLSELRIGDTGVAGPVRVTVEDIEHFAGFTGDTFYAHMDQEAARQNHLFDGRVAHGYLIVTLTCKRITPRLDAEHGEVR